MQNRAVLIISAMLVGLAGGTDTNIDCYLQIHPYYLKHREHKISEKAITEVIDKCLSGQYVPDGGRTAQ